MNQKLKQHTFSAGGEWKRKDLRLVLMIWPPQGRSVAGESSSAVLLPGSLAGINESEIRWPPPRGVQWRKEVSWCPSLSNIKSERCIDQSISSLLTNQANSPENEIREYSNPIWLCWSSNLRHFQWTQVVFLCFVAVASAAELPPIAILSQNFEMADDASNYKQT